MQYNFTSNLPAGDYLNGDIAVTGLPAGVSFSGGDALIYVRVRADGSGMLRFRGDGTQAAVTDKVVTVTIGGATGTFKMTIAPAAASHTVSVGAQVGTMTAGVPSTDNTVTFPVTTSLLNYGGQSPSYDLLDAPKGVDIAIDIVIGNDGKGTLTLYGYNAAAGTYSLRLVIDDVTSAPFTLVISPAATGAPTIASSGQPQNVTVADGGTATFSVTATGTGLSYVWEAYENGEWKLCSQFIVFEGMNTKTLTIPVAYSWLDNYQVRCKVSNAGGSVTSNPATLTILPSVSVGAQVGTLMEGQAGSVTFPVTTTLINPGVYPVTLTHGHGMQGAWMSASNITIASDGTGTLTLNANGTQIAATFDQVYATINGTESPRFTVTVTTITPDFTVQPKDAYVVEGDSKDRVFAVSITRATSSPSLQVAPGGGSTWYDYAQYYRSNKIKAYGTKVVGYMDAYYIPRSWNGDKFRFSASNDYGTTYSQEARLYVSQAPSKPVITREESVDPVFGEDREALIEVEADYGVEYRWQIHHSALGGWANINDIPLLDDNHDTFSVYRLWVTGWVFKQDREARYRCIVSNSRGETISKEFIIREY